MRVIGGKYGGRKLVPFKGDHIRPTMDRVKEVIFNKLQFDIEGARVLDLFSGTGSLAFESLSRGAASVLAVEMSAKSIQVIRKNQALLSVGDELTILQKDVLRFLSDFSGEPFDIILIDPPFTKKMASETMQVLSKACCFNENTEVFIESSSQESILDCYGSLNLQRRQSYGDKYLSHFRKN